jgi:hypothetical protein
LLGVPVDEQRQARFVGEQAQDLRPWIRVRQCVGVARRVRQQVRFSGRGCRSRTGDSLYGIRGSLRTRLPC